MSLGSSINKAPQSVYSDQSRVSKSVSLDEQQQIWVGSGDVTAKRHWWPDSGKSAMQSRVNKSLDCATQCV